MICLTYCFYFVSVITIDTTSCILWYIYKQQYFSQSVNFLIILIPRVKACYLLFACTAIKLGQTIIDRNPEAATTKKQCLDKATILLNFLYYFDFESVLSHIADQLTYWAEKCAIRFPFSTDFFLGKTVFRSRCSRMDQIEFVEDSLQKF